jgi:hypothetical protein
MADAPRDNLFRGLFERAVDLRAGALDQDAPPTMYGHFSVFDAWYPVASWFEGDFVERVAAGAFKRTINDPADRERLRVTFDHGYDINLGDKPLGPIDVLREDDKGPYYEVPLLDTSYNQDFILPALEGRLMNGEKRGSDGLLGASFRFRITGEEWAKAPKKSAHNPDGLPERTITEVRLMEFGPVVYPANPAATASVRSLTDRYLELDLQRSGRIDRLRSRLGLSAPPVDSGHAADGAPAENPDDTPVGRSEGPSQRERRRFLADHIYA